MSNFTPTHNMKIVVKGETKTMPVAMIWSDSDVARVTTRSGRVMNVSTMALIKR